MKHCECDSVCMYVECQYKARGLRQTPHSSRGRRSPNPLQLFVLPYGITLTAANIWSLSGKNKRLTKLAVCSQ